MGTLQRRVPVVTVKVCQALAGAILLSVMPHTATAAQVNVAYVELTICDTVINQGPIFASASNSVVTDTPLCHPAGPVASGAASFTDGSISLSMNGAVPGGGASGRAYLDDYLTFRVPGGGSAVVNVSMSGGWGGTFDNRANGTPDAASFQVEFDLGLGPTFYQGKGYSNLAYDDGNPISHAFTGTDIGGDGPIRNILGSYLFNTNWTVYDGQQTEFYAGLKAQASNIANGHINDPLIITLPAGVTYSSLSGRTYIAPVPAPATLPLLGSGLAGVVLRRFVRRSQAPARSA